MFLVIYKIVDQATNLLHKQQQLSRLEVVFEELKLQRKVLFAQDYYEFFMKIALEAFQYEAEYGSILALDWALELIKEMSDLVEGWRQQYVILVDIGFTMFNYARDVSYRYAISMEEIHQSLSLCDRYRNLLTKTSRLVEGDNNKRYLDYLADVIYIGFVWSSGLHRSDHYCSWAAKKSENILQYGNDSESQCPSILLGLHFYFLAKVYYLCNKINEAWDNLVEAVKHLKCFGETTRSTAAYFYNAVFGK